MAMIASRTQPSFYYMLIARTCVERSRSAAPVRSQALREAALHYLAKARPLADTPGAAAADQR